MRPLARRPEAEAAVGIADEGYFICGDRPLSAHMCPGGGPGRFEIPCEDACR